MEGEGLGDMVMCSDVRWTFGGGGGGGGGGVGLTKDLKALSCNVRPRVGTQSVRMLASQAS